MDDRKRSNIIREVAKLRRQLAELALSITVSAGGGGGDVTGAASSVNNDIVSFNGTDGKTIQDSGLQADTDPALTANSDTKLPTQKATKSYVDTGLAAKQASLGYTAEDVANKDTDPALTANSDTKYASQKAAKTYIDTGLAGKQASLGYTPVPDTRTVNGHALSANVTVSKSDVGLSSVTNDAQLKAADLDTDVALTADSNIKIPSQHAVKSYVDTSVSGAGGGDLSSDTSTSVDGEVALFKSTTGKLIKRATGSGFAKLASGVLSAVATITGADITATDGLLRTVNTYTIDDTWTKPAGIKFVIVEARGGGAGGGGVGTTSGTGNAGGGGQGEFARSKILAASLSSTEAIDVGAGGGGGSGNATGTDGSDSTFGATKVVAKGGKGGLASTGATVNNLGGLGGTGGTGDLLIAGSPGLPSGTIPSGTGGGEGGGRATNGSGNGVAGVRGGGGSGALDGGTTSRTGGAGGAGYIVVYEYY